MSDSSPEREVHPGTVLWYRPEKGQGAVKADSGRHFRFETVEGIADVAKGLRVMVRVDVTTSPPQVVVLPLPSGRREFGVVEPAKPRPTPAKAPSAPRRKTPASGDRPAMSVGPGRRSTRRVAAPKKKLPNGAFQVGTTVLHDQHGQGFVVLSTRSLTRVKFMAYGEERQVKTADLKSLESSK